MDDSVMKETRRKFDSLLKDALKKKTLSKSKESLISDKSSNDNDQEHLICEVSVDVHDNNKSYILDKFLNDTKLHKNDDSTTTTTTIKELPPIPKPRRKKSGSIISSGTYSVKEANNVNVDNVSEHTYSIETVPNNDEQIDVCRKSTSNKRYDSDVDINTKTSTSPSRTSVTADKITYEDETSSKKRRGKTKEAGSLETTNKEENKIPKYTYDEIMAIVVHRTDFLELRSTVIHPMIKIHLINGNTGEYLKKTDDNRTVILHYEDKKISYISAVLTQPFDLQKKRMLYPMWEETLLINEDINYILKKENNAMLFFELIDFMSFTTASSTYSNKGKSNGWHKIAWAFLKLIGKNDVLNINKKIRLQFYKPQRIVSKKYINNVCEPYIWWNNEKREKYLSTLYVTIKSINAQLRLDTFSLKCRRKSHSVMKDDLSMENGDKDVILNGDQINWDKLLHKKCQLPNSILIKLETYDEGCFIAKFSNTGCYLAYSIDQLEEICRFPGHQSLIHSICWSDDDEFIVTASADSSVCLWNVKDHKFVQMLPHPSFVYSAVLKSNIIVSGCFDQILRIWTCENDNDEYILRQELKGHKSYITSICCNAKGDVIYSSDSIGNIIQWQHDQKEWLLRREIIVLEIKEVVINSIKLHKKEKKLLVHSRDNNLCLLNVKNGYVIHWLRGNVNKRIQTNSCFTNCGTFVLAGSENNMINVWNNYTGKLTASFYPYKRYSTTSVAIHCIDFHPKDNIICVSHYGKKLPIILCKYEKTVDNRNAICMKFYDTDKDKE